MNAFALFLCERPFPLLLLGRSSHTCTNHALTFPAYFEFRGWWMNAFALFVREKKAHASHTERRVWQAIHLYHLHNKTCRRDKLTRDMNQETPWEKDLQRKPSERMWQAIYLYHLHNQTCRRDINNRYVNGNPLKKKICNGNLQNACDKEFLFMPYIKDLVKQTCTREPPPKRDLQGKPPKRMWQTIHLYDLHKRPVKETW